jgi:hypothetical protein
LKEKESRDCRYKIIEVLGLDKFFVRMNGEDQHTVTLVLQDKHEPIPTFTRKESVGVPSSPRKYSMGTSQRLSMEEKLPDEILQPNSASNRYIRFDDVKKAKEWIGHLRKALIALPPTDAVEESNDFDYGWKHKVII